MRVTPVRLAALIHWTQIERTFTVSFTSGRGRPALSTRLVAGLLYLQHTFDASDEAVVNTWVENPYWQFFCGETYLQTELPIDPSSLTLWRRRVGEEGVETLLAASIDAARRGDVIQKSSTQQVIVDTTVMPKAIAHPTDSRLLDRSRQHLVKAAEENGLRLRQNYNRVAPRLAAHDQRVLHVDLLVQPWAEQFGRLWLRRLGTHRTPRKNLQENLLGQNHTLQILRPSTRRTASRIKGLRVVQDGLATQRKAFRAVGYLVVVGLVLTHIVYVALTGVAQEVLRALACALSLIGC